ncbi:S1 RNA-binding domain-containing protein [candidate division KSB1 bacterium]|nr:S1 RNA-binding domain-containing protein [candidate division KSB1 bacterium]
MEPHEIVEQIAAELNLAKHQIKNTIDLLDKDNTVPFIARYRKEVTGSLNEEQIRAIWDRIRYIRHMEERKATVLKSIAEQGKLTPKLESQIKAVTKLQEVEDLYLPYKPKRRTRGIIAREKGLEPLADLILKEEITKGDPIEYAKTFINAEKGVESAEQALTGASDIVAEIISEDAQIRKIIRKATLAGGFLSSKAKEPANCQDYEIYKEFSEPVKTVPPHRILAINRGEREHFLQVSIDVSEKEMNQHIRKLYITNNESIFTDLLTAAIADAYRRLIAPAIEREIRKLLTERADNHAIQVFAKNLYALLMTPPMHNNYIMGIDPGYRTGCKVAVIDPTGKYLQGDTIFPHPPQSRWQEAKETITEFIQAFNIKIVAIGNGTASRETEKLVAEILAELEIECHYTIVNEAGASVYSASPVAKKEFPQLDASMRGNISIARRLLDPLSELVKIDPKSIGVGLYQHDVDQNKLAETLDHVVESSVNQVGVDVNTASASLLKYIAGINKQVADRIVEYREQNGPFINRQQLQSIKGLGANAFTQSAGFMRIPNSDIFFDSTAVHPESYVVTERLLRHLGLEIKAVRARGSIVREKVESKKISMQTLTEICGCGIETLMDIIDSLEKPNRDPRDEMPKPILRNDVLSMDDLAPDMILKGTVRNVIDFGIFVDIGVKQDGLVHISQLSKKYIKHPLDIVSVGDIVTVRIINVDKERGRIGLSMLFES